MSNQPKDLKAVKKRIRVWRIFARIARTAFITLTVSSLLVAIGCAVLFIGAVSALPSRWGDGGPPLPPAKPKLRYARIDCINEVKKMMRYERFVACHREPPPRGETTYFYSYNDIHVTILQEYDYYPYYVFYGRVRLTKPDELPSPVKDTIPPERQTDFFLVNAFNPGAAERYKGDGYHPEHYIWMHVNFGYENLKK